jgi:hypothetical protein
MSAIRRVYFTCSRWAVDETSQIYKSAFELTRSRFPGAVVFQSRTFYRGRTFSFWSLSFSKELAGVDALVVFTPDQIRGIGRGVWAEITEAALWSKPVYWLNRGRFYASSEFRVELHEKQIGGTVADLVLREPTQPVIESQQPPVSKPTCAEYIAHCVSEAVDKKLVKPARKTPFWYTNDGRRLRVQDMDNEHLLNAVRLMRSHHMETIMSMYNDLRPDTIRSHKVSWSLFLENFKIVSTKFPMPFIIRMLVRIPAYKAMLLEADRCKLAHKPHHPIPLERIFSEVDLRNEWENR